MLRVYVAAPGQDASTVLDVHHLMRARGLIPTSSWAEKLAGIIDPATSDTPPDSDALRIAAHQNDADLLSSHACLVLARAGAGGEMFAEAKLASMVGMPILWCGRKTLSAWREGVVRVDDSIQAIALLATWNANQEFRARAADGLLSSRLWCLHEACEPARVAGTVQ